MHHRVRCECSECDDDEEIMSCLVALINDVVIEFEVQAHGENEQRVVASARRTIALLPLLKRIAGPQSFFDGLCRPNSRQSSSHAANTFTAGAFARHRVWLTTSSQTP